MIHSQFGITWPSQEGKVPRMTPSRLNGCGRSVLLPIIRPLETYNTQREFTVEEYKRHIRYVEWKLGNQGLSKLGLQVLEDFPQDSQTNNRGSAVFRNENFDGNALSNPTCPFFRSPAPYLATGAN